MISLFSRMIALFLPEFQQKQQMQTFNVKNN